MPRSSPAIADGRVRGRARGGRGRACASPRRSSRTLTGRASTRMATLAIARCTRPYEERRARDRSQRQGGVHHRRESRYRRRRRASALGPRASASGSPRAAATTSGSRTRSASSATFANATRSRRRLRRHGRALRTARHLCRERGRRLVLHAGRHARRAPRGDDRRQPEGHDLRDARVASRTCSRSGEGDIITVASEAGRRGLPGEAVYCASKFGQVGLTRALDHELREHGVRCTNVCPGGVATDFALEEGYGRHAGGRSPG